MAATEKAPAAEPAAKKGPPIVMIIAITAIVAFGLGFVILKSVLAKDAKPASTDVVIGETVPLDEFLVNLADTDAPHYVKTTIGLGLIEGKTADAFKTKVPEARDAIVMILAQKSLSQIDTTAGKVALKSELLDNINKAVGDKEVGAVYFEAFATQ